MSAVPTRIKNPVRVATREHRALCRLARLTPPPSIADVPADLDGAAFATYAVGHNLAPLVYIHLGVLERAGARTPLPDEVRTRLKNDYFFSLALATTLHTAFGAIVEALAARGIEWIPLKGLLFGRTLYGSPDARPMTDLDFLVRPEKLDAASAVLEEMGYTRSIPPGRRATHEEMFERHYHRPTGAFAVKVEPHSGLGQASRYRVDTEALWERSVPLSRFGITDWGTLGRALSPEDNLVHLFLHQANSVFDEIDLRSPLDIHELVSQWRPDWDQVLARAREWRVVAPMFLALEAARSLYGTLLPPEVVHAIRPGAIRRAWLARFIDTRGLGLYLHPAHPPWLKRVAVGFGTMDRPGDAIRYALAYAGQRARDVRAGR